MSGRRQLTRTERLARRRRRRRSALLLLVWAAVLTPLWWLRPARFLDGDVAYVIVAGRSMQPTYQPGDLVIVRRAGEYRPGDVALYRVPEDEPGGGMAVIHRIVERGAGGTFVFKGDNRDTADDWTITEDDVFGRARYLVPGAGTVLHTIVSPPVLATLMGVTVMWAAWPRRRRASDDAVTALVADDEADRLEVWHFVPALPLQARRLRANATMSL